MTENILNKAGELALELQGTEEYRVWLNAFKNVQENEEAKNMMTKFAETQTKFDSYMQAGKAPSEAEMKEWNELASKIQQDELMNQMLSAEQGLNEMMGKLNAIITKPITDHYEKLRK